METLADLGFFFWDGAAGFVQGGRGIWYFKRIICGPMNGCHVYFLKRKIKNPCQL
jgi:hypothetical protein